MPVPSNDTTGNARYRTTWTGKLILQVETVDDGSRDAHRWDVYVLGWIAENRDRWERFCEIRQSERNRRIRATITEGKVRKGGQNRNPTEGFARRPAPPTGSAVTSGPVERARLSTARPTHRQVRGGG